MAVENSTAVYIFDNSWEEARQRLTLLEECFDPNTTRHLEALGVGPGWRCLEIGGGGGSVTQWLCRRVGPEGQVVAVDLDTRFLDELAEDNLEVHRRNIVTEGLPGPAGGPGVSPDFDSYDLIHTRAVLMHIPERERILEACAAALRPGGWLLLEEADNYPVLALASGVYLEAWRQGCAAMAAVGMSSEWARDLPVLLDRTGLDDVATETSVTTFRGGSPYARLLHMTFEQARPLLLAGGMKEETLDEVYAELDDPVRWFQGFAMVSARGRRPTTEVSPR